MNTSDNMNPRIFFRALLLLWVMVLGYSVYAQEFLTGIGTNVQIMKQAQQYKQCFTNGKADPKPILLPFFEDFSNYTGYPNENLFVDKQAYVNNTFPVYPPTIGVVTLDALDEYGKIYAHLNEVSKGADTLTSRFIRLDSLFVADTIRKIESKDSLYFSFYFQPGGAGAADGSVGEHIGNQPNQTDSLVLEFGYPKIEKDTAYTVWNHIWSTPGFNVKNWLTENPLQYFKQVMIPITDTNYLCNKFQFRFRNYVSLEPQLGIAGWEGNVDLWHIDYIRLDVNRYVNDVFTNDLAFVSPTTSLLKNYQSMPWKQFQVSDMKSNFTNQLTNLHNGKRTPRYQYNIKLNGNLVDEYTEYWTGAKDINPYCDSGLYENSVVTKPKIKYIPHLTDTATFKITHIFANNSDEDFCFANDTCVFEQKFMNYYAYDDGTAEYGYCLNNQYNIAFLAMKFPLFKPDSLSAVRMWFNHTKNSENENALFSIVVWKDTVFKVKDEEISEPGRVLYYFDQFRPQFESQFLDFWEYRFDKKVSVSGNIWIGFEQQGNVQLNIGFDQNNDSREFFRYNTKGSWETSSFKGTPMLRPVFGNPLNLSVPQSQISTVKIYPNPTTGELRIEMGDMSYETCDMRYEIYDVYGREVSNLKSQISNHQGGKPQADGLVINISHLPAGIYFLRILTENGAVTKKIIKI
jgi:hypothetical protein